MHETSELHKSLLANPEAVKEARITIAGTVYGEAYIFALSASASLYDSGAPDIGGCTARTIDLSVWIPSKEIPRMAEIRVEQRLIVRNRLTDEIELAAEWIPKGTFFVSHRDVDEVSGATVLQGYDAMRKADQDYVPDSDTEWPRPSNQVFEDIAGRMGIAVDGRSALDPSILVEYPIDYTMREVLGQIAVAHGGNCVISDAGELRLIGLAEIPEETFYLADEQGAAITLGGVRILV